MQFKDVAVVGWPACILSRCATFALFGLLVLLKTFKCKPSGTSPAKQDSNANSGQNVRGERGGSVGGWRGGEGLLGSGKRSVTMLRVLERVRQSI